MNVQDFDYDLPRERIAQVPADPRDGARLFVHSREKDESRHLHVRDLAEVLAPGDLLVVNDARVRPARLYGRRESGGAVELLLLAPSVGAPGAWRAMVKPAAKPRPGEVVTLESGQLAGRMLARELDASGRGTAFWSVAVSDPNAPERDVVELLEEAGHMPLPPYIERAREGDPRDAADRERYQTVFAKSSGAVAAPTAGLHFTPELLARLDSAGVERASVTLHVGLGTFLPVTVEDTRAHSMHSEEYELPGETAEAIALCRARGGRVVAVGTTSVRVLEQCATEGGNVKAESGATRLFIEPGYGFRVVDGLMTNFHLPRSTLLMLVSALVGRERVLLLYAEAIERGYRFYSYGDAMVLLP